MLNISHTTLWAIRSVIEDLILIIVHESLLSSQIDVFGPIVHADSVLLHHILTEQHNLLGQ